MVNYKFTRTIPQVSPEHSVLFGKHPQNNIPIELSAILHYV